MRTRKNFVMMALVALAIGVVVPQAMATTPEGDPASGKFPVSGTAASGASVLSTASTEIQCASGSGAGQATSKTTGEGSYILHGCKSTGVSCSSAGQPSGTIKIETVNLHLVYLDENHTNPGVLATPPASGVFAKFVCAFGLVKVEVKGNGVLGEITSPNCGESSSTATVVSETVKPGTQKYMQVEETGTLYDMAVSVNGGAFETAATTWSVTGTSVGGEKSTLTCP